ncbi:MAG TPA: DPP IV N-terminal domain-containing protein [Longimicrobiales bacterium]|nr:DPP IV N-terminal domain-containing protein [Longimicrobiales bacterium]
MKHAPAALTLVCAVLTSFSALCAQQQPQDIRARYERAAQLLGSVVEPLVHRAEVRPEWPTPDRFWYRVRTPDGHEFITVDAARGTRERAFDHEHLARTLTEVTGTAYSPWSLPLERLRPTQDGRGLGFELDRRRWECDVVAYTCERPATAIEAVTNSVMSPDGRYAAFRREHDLWVRDMAAGGDVRLTSDGAERYGYATDNEGWRRSDRPAVTWSPDGSKLLTFRLDERGVGDMHLLQMAAGRPVLHSWAYALPGDSVVPMHEWVIADVDAGRVVPVQAPADHQRSSSCCGRLRGDAIADTEWSPDGRQVAFMSVSRDYRDVALRIADAATGAVRTVIEERGEPYFESSGGGRGVPNWRVLHDRSEVIWYSNRDGFGHLYLYDLATGTLKNRITEGPWLVVDVLHVDQAGGWVYFTAVNREPGRDPYHRHLYRVRLNGQELALLTPEDADHVITMSPDGRWFTSTHSTVSRPPVTVLRRADGGMVVGLEEANVAQLVATGWTPPEPFTVKARDGETDLHGVMYRPSDFDPSRRYPIINHIYPGPQAGSVGPRTFSAGRRGNAQALAELGFVVVQMDGLGSPMRSLPFQAYYHGNLADNGLPDQIAGMRELAARHPWIDLDRVGIYGHSGGGFATAAAMLQHPDFFHVGVASAGNMDNRGYTYYWGEKWQGLLEPRNDGTDTYTNQAVQLAAANLQGRLLIAYGTMDNNVHPNMTLQLINELIRHDRDFDTIVMPNRNHGFANEPYFVRRTWDYFVTHLRGETPPREFRIVQ